MTDELTKCEGFEQVGMAVVVAAGIVAKALPGVQAHPEFAALIDVVGPPMGFSLGRFSYHLLSHRMPKYSKGLVAAYDNDPKNFEEHARQQAENPDYHEVMYRSFRQMLDAADESVIETLGYLAGQYTYAGKKPDAFFRGLGRLLVDLEPGELADMKMLVRQLVDASPHGQAIAIVDPNRDLWLGPFRGNMSHSNAFGVEATRRIFTLLKREGLAIDPPPGAPQATGRESIVIDHAIIVELEVLNQVRATISPAE